MRVGAALTAEAEARAAALRRPATVRLPGPGPVLFIAPHPDDEALGAGGTLRKHVEAGDEVSVLFVTDGARGGGRGRGGRVAALRQREAEASCAVLGCARVEFMGAPDGRFRAEPGLVASLGDAIARLRPRLVYAPGPAEHHRDHLLTAALVAEAWRARGGDWAVCAYEVWTPIAPNCVVNVTAQMEVKRAALRCHASQLESIDYLSAAEGLARYRAALIPVPGARFAEAFWRARPGDYVRALGDVLAAGWTAEGERSQAT